MPSVYTSHQRAVARRLLRFYKTHGWTRRAMARTAKGLNARPASDEACRFCPLGAMKRIYVTDYAVNVGHIAEAIEDAELASSSSGCLLPHPRCVIMRHERVVFMFNDSRNRQQVLKFLRSIAG
jgi:hypothetical protein